MKKAINFDIDTKKYEKLTDKKSPNAYIEINKYLKKREFIHRQGSGYISKEELTDKKITSLITDMTIKLSWFKYCIKNLDVTNIGKQHSLLYTVKNVSIELNNEILISNYIKESILELEKLFKQSVSLFINKEIY